MLGETQRRLLDGLQKLIQELPIQAIVVVVSVRVKLDVITHKRMEGVTNISHRVADDHSVSIYSQYGTDKDFDRISSNSEELLKCCFYYGGLSSTGAKTILRNSDVGTYLIRDSSDPKYLYSISLKTERGTTSVRIVYSHGMFRLDSEDKLRSKMPKFLTVLQLLEYYVELSQSDASKHCRWLESSGRKDVPVTLTKPRLSNVQPLQHLTRLTINANVPIEKLEDTGLPRKLISYLRDYPYNH